MKNEASVILSERLKKIRDDVVFLKSFDDIICAQREYHFTLGVAEAAEKYRGNNTWLTAAGTAAVICGMPAKL